MTALVKSLTLYATNIALLSRQTVIGYASVRGRKRWLRPMLKDLYDRRIEQGPEPERHRSQWLNWNYNSELFAFGKRLGEELSEQTLRTAFVNKSYIEKEEKRRSELDVEEQYVPLTIEHNDALAQKGEEVSCTYIKAYLRQCYPRFPEEGIQAVCDHLMSDSILAHVGQNLGIKDLIFCGNASPGVAVLAHSFKAVIGAVAADQGNNRAQLFVQDFMLTQLTGRDINELWDIPNPMGLLGGLLRKQGLDEPEPRLLHGTGSQTILASYVVGVYSNKQLIGQGYGETVPIAEEMAARDALHRAFGTKENTNALKFGDKGHSLQIHSQTVNPSILQYEQVSELPEQ